MSTSSTLFTSSTMKIITTISEAELFELPAINFAPSSWSAQKAIAAKNLWIGFVCMLSSLYLELKVS